MLADDVGTFLFGFGDGYVSAETVGSRGVVDGDEALPLLYGERLVGGDLEAYHFALRVEGVEVNVRDDAERAVGGIVGEGGKVLEGEFAAAFAVG